MSVAVFGHSYVRDLQQLGYSHLVYPNISVPINYFSFPGFGFHNFILNPGLLDNLVSCKPDIVIIFLGGNDIKVNVDINFVKRDCEQFYSILRLRLPKAIFVVSQVVLRHTVSVNRHGTPAFELFRKLANNFNKWVARQKFKDKLLLINGENKLSNVNFFRSDGVHLNKQGLELVFSLIHDCLSDAVLSLKK